MKTLFLWTTVLFSTLVSATTPAPRPQDDCTVKLMRLRGRETNFTTLPEPMPITVEAILPGQKLVTESSLSDSELSHRAPDNAQGVVLMLNDSLFRTARKELDAQVRELIGPQDINRDTPQGSALLQTLDGVNRAFGYTFFGMGDSVLSAQVHRLEGDADEPTLHHESLLRYLLRTSGGTKQVGQTFIIYYGIAPKSGADAAAFFTEFVARWDGANTFSIRSVHVHLGDVAKSVKTAAIR